jgi:ABC-type branched-subunit amino acid transport system substrate-binding protein
MLTVAAGEKAKSLDGSLVRDALETITGFQGTTGIYNFSAENHQGITENPFFIAMIRNGKVEVVQ